MPGYGVDAVDIAIKDVVPVRALRDSTPLLDDRAALDRRYAEDGYLFFRGMLPKAGVEAARRRMLEPLVARGWVRIEGDSAVWTGGEADDDDLPEDSREYDGVCQTLFDWPGSREAMERLLGEPASLVPIVQYRAYRPGAQRGRVHQDGFFSPGIEGYRPIWIPLVEMDEEVGGLALAVGMTGRGYFHNTDKPPGNPIPAAMVPREAWARADYRPGDVLVVHPETPHVGLANRSDRVIRLSFDTRVQSAARPSVIMGDVVSCDREQVTLRCPDGSLETLRLSDQTFIRTTEAPNVRITRDEFARGTSAGLRLVASREGDRAMMLRRAVAG